MKRYPLLAACAVAALAVTGCGGGSSSVTPTGITQQQSQSSKATMHITIPPKSSGTSAGKRGAQYISPSTMSGSFTIGSLAPQIVDLSPTSTYCTGAQDTGGTQSRTCTIIINANVGDDQTLVIKTYDAANATGNVLTNNTENINVSADAGSNNENYVLNGVLDHFTVTLDPTSVDTTVPTDITASVTPYDAGSNIIIGTPVNADGSALDSNNLSLTASPSTGITIDAFDGDNGTFPVHYDGSSTTSPVTFTLALTGYTSATAQLTVNGAPTPPPGISNGDFASGALVDSHGFGWTSCSIAHTALSAAVNASPAPKSVSAQSATSAISPALTAAVVQLPANWNPDHTSDALPPGAINAALTGDVANETKGASGICQTFQVPSDGTATQLTFWVYELGGEYKFAYADQEADLTTGGDTPVTTTLFAEVNCFQDPTGFPTQTPATTSGCWPNSLGGDSNNYNDWQGGYWVQRGPFDLTPYVGQSVTLFIGSWDSGNDTTGKYGNAMYVTDVQLQAAGTGSVNVTGRSHR